MENKKISKKALKSLLNDSMREAIGNLELPRPTKKVKKLLDKSAKKLASVFATILKKKDRKARKSEKALAVVDEVLKGKKNRKNNKLQAIESI